MLLFSSGKVETMHQSSIFDRILKSVRDGSLLIKILNRCSRIEYVPIVSPDTVRYFAKNHPDKNWRKVSPIAKKVWVEFTPIFTKQQINTIAYVGANDGTMALVLNELFPERIYYLFEPLPDIYAKLVENVTGHKNMYCIHSAVGDKEELLDIYVDTFSPASSILPYEPVALQEYPYLGKQAVTKVHVNTLDDLLKRNGVSVVDLIIIDVQGYEDKVLQGAGKTLKACKVVISELSLQKLYRGSSTFNSVYQTLISEGFRLLYLFNPMKGKSQAILQIDGVFIRE